MKYLTPSPLIALALIGTQLLGPAALWAMEQRGIRVDASKQLIVTGLAGGEVTAGANGERRTLLFRDTVQPGEQLIVPAQATVEVLIGIRALLAAHGPARIIISEDVPGQIIVKLDQGELTLAVAGTVLTPGQAVTIQTPIARTVVRSGIVKTTIESNGSRVSSLSEEPQGNLHRVSFNAQVAAVAKSNLVETIQSFEGSSDVQAMEGGGGGATLKAGDSVQVLGGKIIKGTPIETNTRIEPTLLAAIEGHANTPAGGTENLIAAQMALAGGLGQVLVGASETKDGMGTGGANATGNALLSTIFGANFGSGSGAGSPLTFLFGGGSGSGSGSGGSGGSGGTGGLFGTAGAGGSALFSSQGSAINSSGAGVGDDVNDGGTSLNSTDLRNSVPILISASAKGGLGLLTIGKLPANAIFLEQASSFKSTELLLIDGGVLSQAPHNGTTPTSALIARGLLDGFQRPLIIGAPGNTGIDYDLTRSFTSIANPNSFTRDNYEIRTKAGNLFDVFSVNRNQNILTNQSFTAGTGPITNNPALVLQANVTIEGTNVRLFLKSDTGVIPAGDRFIVSTQNLTNVNGSGGIQISQEFNLAGTQPERDPQRLPTVIIKSTQDKAKLFLDLLPNFSSQPGGQVCVNCGSGGSERIAYPSLSLVDAAVTASSSSDPTLQIFDSANPGADRTVELTGGVVLTDSTAVTLTNQVVRQNSNLVGQVPVPFLSPTSTYFSSKGLTPIFDASLIGILASGTNPAFVRIQDRILGVLNGSSIKPEIVGGNELKVALLSVLDSQLKGPTTRPLNPFFDPTQPVGPNNLQFNRDNVAPLIEIVDSLPTTGDGVRVTSGVVVRSTGVLNNLLPTNGALLEIGDASNVGGPLALIQNSRVNATGNFVDVSGTIQAGRHLLSANVSDGALVRVDATQFTVGQDVVNASSQTSVSVRGNLFNAKGTSNTQASNILGLAGTGTQVSITNGSVALLENGSTTTLRSTGGNVISVASGGTLTLTGNGADLKDSASLTLANGQVLNVAGAGSRATITNGSVALLSGAATMTVGSTAGHVVSVTTANPTAAAVTVAGNILDLQNASRATVANGNVANLFGNGRTLDVTGSVAVLGGSSLLLLTNPSAGAGTGHVLHLENGAQSTITKNILSLNGPSGVTLGAAQATLTRGSVLDLVNGSVTLSGTGGNAAAVAVLSGRTGLSLTNGHVANVADGVATINGHVLDLHGNAVNATSTATLSNGSVLNATGGTTTVGTTGAAGIKGSIALVRDGHQLTLTNGSVASVAGGTTTMTLANGNVLDASGTSTLATITTGSVLTANGGMTNIVGSVALLGANSRLALGNGDVARVSNGTVDITGNVADLQNASTLNANAGQVLNQSGGTVTTQGNLAFVSGATANLARIASVSGGTTSVLGNVASVLNGGVLNLSGDSLLKQLGGTVTIGSSQNPGTGLFLSGSMSHVNFATTAHMVNIGAGALNVFGNVANLVGGANLTLASGGHLANVVGVGPGATNFSVTGVLAFLDASQLTLNNGYLLNLARTGSGATSATLNGGFFSLVNGSTLSLSGNSLLASVGVGTELNLAGIKPGTGPTLGFFGAAGIGGPTNTLSIGNTLCSGGAVCTTVAGGIRVLGQGFTTVDELNARIVFKDASAQAQFAAFRVDTNGSATIKTANNVTTPAINLETALLTIQKMGHDACTDATCGKIVIK